MEGFEIEDGRRRSREGSGQHQQESPDNCDQVHDLIRQAENAKTKMFATPGKYANSNQKDINQLFTSSALVDESYIVVGGHLDEVMIEKISKGDYVDFAKLIPRDKIASEEDT